MNSLPPYARYIRVGGSFADAATRTGNAFDSARVQNKARRAVVARRHENRLALSRGLSKPRIKRDTVISAGDTANAEAYANRAARVVPYRLLYATENRVSGGGDIDVKPGSGSDRVAPLNIEQGFLLGVRAVLWRRRVGRNSRDSWSRQ